MSDNLIESFKKSNCIKEGEFKLRNGETSKYYFDILSSVLCSAKIVTSCQNTEGEIIPLVMITACAVCNAGLIKAEGKHAWICSFR